MYVKRFKRVLDIIFSLILMPVVLLVIFFIGCVIKLEDRGPVFYKAKRLGEKGKIYNMFKLRSMRVNAPDIRNEDGSTYSSDNDFRLTKIGSFIRKTSIDEIPQIVNVLRGDMSFVGPRPDMPDALTIYQDKERDKLSVKPGITGYNQAYFRNAISQKEKFENDLFYVNNISLIWDFKIVLVTIKNVIIKKNINISKKN